MRSVGEAASCGHSSNTAKEEWLDEKALPALAERAVVRSLQRNACTEDELKRWVEVCNVFYVSAQFFYLASH